MMPVPAVIPAFPVVVVSGISVLPAPVLPIRNAVVARVVVLPAMPIVVIVIGTAVVTQAVVGVRIFVILIPVRLGGTVIVTILYTGTE